MLDVVRLNIAGSQFALDPLPHEQHIYYFPVEGVQGASIPGLICQEAIGRRADGFNVFVGEFSLQALLNNTLDGRQAVYESQVRAFQQYLSGRTFWTARFDVSLCQVSQSSIR